MNEQIFQQWCQWVEDYGEEAILNRVPKFVIEPGQPRVPEHPRLAVIGLNPSFPEADNLCEGLMNWMHKQGLKYPEDFNWNDGPFTNGANFNDVTTKVQAMAELHSSEARYHYPRFFARINRLARAMGVNVDDYVHLDIYLSLTAKRVELDGCRKRFRKMAEQQEKWFQQLLRDWKPQRIVCMYAGVAHRLGKIFKQQLNWQPIQHLSLSEAQLALNGEVVPVYKPIRAAIPNGRWGMSEVEFQGIEDYFQQNPLQ